MRGGAHTGGRGSESAHGVTARSHHRTIGADAGDAGNRSMTPGTAVHRRMRNAGVVPVRAGRCRPRRRGRAGHGRAQRTVPVTPRGSTRSRLDAFTERRVHDATVPGGAHASGVARHGRSVAASRCIERRFRCRDPRAGNSARAPPAAPRPGHAGCGAVRQRSGRAADAEKKRGPGTGASFRLGAVGHPLHVAYCDYSTTRLARWRYAPL